MRSRESRLTRNECFLSDRGAETQQSEKEAIWKFNEGQSVIQMSENFTSFLSRQLVVCLILRLNQQVYDMTSLSVQLSHTLDSRHLT